MAVSNDNYYRPDGALHELMLQKTIVDVAVDIQATLRILVDKGLITREEVSRYREEVRDSPKYKPVIEEIQRQQAGFQAAKDDPRAHLRAIFEAKAKGLI